MSVNETDPRLAGTGTGLSPHIINNSSSRLLMLGSMLSQMLVIKGATERRMITGSEPEYAKATWKVSVPAEAKIIKVIEKFPRKLGSGNYKQNTESLVVFEDLEARAKNILEIGCVTIKSHHSSHQSFGFEYKQTKAQAELRPGNFIPKGTVLCKSPNIADNGNYKYGIEVPTAFMSVPQIIEDGVVVSEELCKQMETTIMGERMASWGKHSYPRNIYGNDKVYKAHPDHGEKIRDDGLLFALCEYEEMHGVCEMDKYTLNDPEAYDPIFDELTFAEKGATITDINVYHNHFENNPPTPIGMDVQQRKYLTSQTTYYREILNVVSQYYMKEKNVKLSKDLHVLTVKALDNDPRVPSGAVIGGGTPNLDPISRNVFGRMGNSKVVRTNRANPIDDWTIKLTYAKQVIPTIGFKITGLHGNKAVICDVRPVEEMPKDDWGHIAHCIFDGDSSIKRNNVGCLFEQYTNAASRDCSEDILAMHEAGNDVGARKRYMDYVRITSPKHYALLEAMQKAGKFEEHFQGIITAAQNPTPLVQRGEEGVDLWLPTNNPVHSAALIEAIEYGTDEDPTKFPIRRSPVTYVGKSGKTRRTKTDVIIGSVYMLLLEKTGSDFAAVATAKRNYLGVLSKLTNSDKYSQPYREQPTRLLAEAEIRLLVSMVGPVIAQRLLEYPNSAAAQKIITNTTISLESIWNEKSSITVMS